MPSCKATADFYLLSFVYIDKHLFIPLFQDIGLIGEKGKGYKKVFFFFRTSLRISASVAGGHLPTLRMERDVAEEKDCF
jgi:hypothetical protein